MDSNYQKIVIKTPFSSEGKEDFPLNVCLTWSVKQLKEHLETLLPRNPKADGQKLILSGRILHDKAVLKDCFRSVSPGCFPILHLVHKPSEGAPVTSAAMHPENAAADVTEGLRQRNNVADPSQASATEPVPQYSSYPSALDQAQMMQQMYQNYMHQYMLSYSQFASVNMMVPPAMMNQFVPYRDFPAALHVPNNNQHNPQMMPQLNVQAAPQVVMNAQGGAIMNEDEGGQRDVLDWAYMSLRLVILICVICFYSSTSRFFSVFTLLGIFLLFNTIRDIRRIRERHRRHVQEQQQQQQQAASPPNPANVPAEIINDPQAPEALPVAQPQNQVGLISTLFNIVVGFVASIVPDNVGHAVAN